jgi:hypothetical protein
MYAVRAEAGEAYGAATSAAGSSRRLGVRQPVGSALWERMKWGRGQVSVLA